MKVRVNSVVKTLVSIHLLMKISRTTNQCSISQLVRCLL